ncbi:MAG: hypothetical protein MRZ79_00645 [Bacteroidia bacterium]|nr:hypothetical protein [Bacteroidia bacterium]
MKQLIIIWLVALMLVPFSSIIAQDRQTNTLLLASLLAENEELVKEWVENKVDVFYLNANYSVDTSGLHGLYRFFDEPFGENVSTNLEPFARLKSYIDQNEAAKSQVESGSYPALKECFPELPLSYDEFVNSPKILLTDDMRLCIQLDKWSDFIFRVVDGTILQTYWEEGLFSTSKREALLSAHRILRGQGTPSDSFAIRNLSTIARDLEGQISLMKIRKEGIPYYLYAKLRSCNAFYPRQYVQFVNEDKFILEEITIACFFRKISEDEKSQIQKLWQAIDFRSRSFPERDDETGAPIITNTEGGLTPEEGTSVLSNLTRLSPSTIIIDASAQFLVERTREELVLSFFDQFQKRIDSLEELQYLFDNTYALLSNREILKVPSLGKAWQEAFEMDLRLLPNSFERMVEESPQYAFLKEETAFRLYKFTHGLVKKDSLTLESGLKKLSKKRLEDCKNSLDTSFYLTYRLLEDFRISENGDFLEIKDQMEDLGERAREFFIAIQYQKAPQLFQAVKTSEGNASLADRMENQTQLFFEKEIQVAALFSNIDRDIQGLDRVERPEISEENAAYFQQLLKDYLDKLPANLSQLGSIAKQMVRSAFMFQYFENESQLYADPTYLRLMGVIQGGTDLVGAIESREPSRILISSIQVLQPFFEILQEKEIARIRGLEIEATQKSGPDKVFARVEINRAIHRLEQVEAVSQHLGFYGGFFLDVLSAKTSEDVKAALYRYALPPGSYRLKRESLFSLELGAMPGFYTGVEWVADSTLSNRSMSSGFSVPVGISLSWGRRKSTDLDAKDPYKYVLKGDKAKAKQLKGSSIGLYIPILDLAAPFSYRWQNGFDGGLPDEVYWQQILSPGAYVVWGLKGAPVSISAGAQYLPRLRSISASGNELVDFDAVRAGINVSLDLPLFSIIKR